MVNEASADGCYLWEKQILFISYHDVPFQELGRLQIDANSVSVACADVTKTQTTERTVKGSPSVEAITDVCTLYTQRVQINIKLISPEYGF